MHWERKVRALPPATNLDYQGLIDHLPVILDDIADSAEAALAGDRPPPLRSDPDRHAVIRLQQGYDLGHVVTEYSLLREAILELSASLSNTYPEELRVFNRILDRALQQAVHRYAEARHRILNAVDRISTLAFGGHRSEDDLLLALLKIMLETAPEVDEVTVMLKEGDRLYVRQTIGIMTQRAVGFSLAVGEGLSGQVAASGEPLFVRSAETDPLVKSEFLKEHKLKALYGVPLLDGTDVIGVAHMGSTTAYEFLEEDMLLFRAMANRASQMLVEARLKAQLRQQHEELRLVLQHAKLGTFTREIEHGTQKWDARTRELFGIGAEEDISFDRALSLIAPADRERVRDVALRASDTGEDFQLRYRAIRPDGTERYLDVRGGRVVGAGGLHHLVGVVQDRTADHYAERERELFLAALGHDLRSPLQTISMGMSNLFRTPALPEQVVKTAHRVARASAQMKRLIEQLLDFARARAGNPIAIDRRRVDLAELWHQVIDDLAVTSPDRTIELRITTSTVGAWDPDRMLQVFQNLAANAVEYGDPRQPIAITLSGDAETIFCEVHNFGAPIPKELIPTIFDPFRRGRRGGHGLGLGLYIANQIAVGHEGRIEVTSSEEAGTTFCVRLPRHVEQTSSR